MAQAQERLWQHLTRNGRFGADQARKYGAADSMAALVRLTSVGRLGSSLACRRSADFLEA